MRVLKPEGSLFVNLGDKYASAGGSQRQGDDGQMADRAITEARRRNIGEKAHREDGGLRRSGDWGIPNKSLLGLPWRYALACMDDLGLILRRDIIWHKTNPLPESVTDRCRTTHEYLFHFVSQPRYYSAVDEIRVPTPDAGRKPKSVKAGLLTGSHGAAGHDGNGMRMAESYNNPLGALPGSVWEIASEPLNLPAYLGVEHFAAFPTALVRPVILGWSPPGVCTACGEGRRPVVDKRYVKGQSGTSGFKKDGKEPLGRLNGTGMAGKPAMDAVVSVIGYACACPDDSVPARPAVVLDPFGGTGTTALVAVAHGRHGLSFDRSGGYSRAARWRTRDSSERAKARGEAKPPPAKRERHDLYGGLTDDLDALLEESL